MVEKPITPKRRLPLRAVTRVALGIGLLAFLLPFASVSCGTHEVLRASGLNAAVGGQYTVGGGQAHFYSGNEYFLVALLSAVIALACQFLRRHPRARAIVGTVAGVSGVVMLLVGQTHANSQILDLHSGGVVTIKWGVGYWTCLIALGAGAVLGAAGLYGLGVRSTVAPVVPPPPTALATTTGGVIAMLAALMIIAASALPYVLYNPGLSGSLEPSSPSLLMPEFGPSNWFAAEPLAVAILAFVSGVVLVEWMSRIPQAIAVGALLAFGVQTFLLFFGYVALAIGNESASVRPGGIVGMVAGVLLFGGGLAPALKLFARPAPIPDDSPTEGTASPLGVG